MIIIVSVAVCSTYCERSLLDQSARRANLLLRLRRRVYATDAAVTLASSWHRHHHCQHWQGVYSREQNTEEGSSIFCPFIAVSTTIPLCRKAQGEKLAHHSTICTKADEKRNTDHAKPPTAF
ncbi:hypothetical protein TcWFU_009904 [Taenia crassiceps]|uniref:Secreted protein n=1 Tax=Taenia crassiceps TaxID=6207 RepID=A0ABR4QCD7_9CEST